MIPVTAPQAFAQAVLFGVNMCFACYLHMPMFSAWVAAACCALLVPPVGAP